MIIWANKTWRALRNVIVYKIKELIKQIKYKFRKDPVSIQAKFKTFISDFEMSKDPKIHYKLLSCMIFLARRKSYKSIIKVVAPNQEWLDFMLKEAKFMRDCNDNKTKDLTWNEIFAHPILSLAKTLFYQEQELQDRFFIKSLG